MKRNTKNMIIIICGSIILFIIICLFIDRRFYMTDRINNSLWEAEDYDDYKYIGDFIHSDMYQIRKDTILFNNRRKALIKYQYFNMLVIKDIETQKRYVYSRKGTHNILF
jgi:hypothetical protein